jgi:hypothetical protein
MQKLKTPTGRAQSHGVATRAGTIMAADLAPKAVMNSVTGAAHRHPKATIVIATTIADQSGVIARHATMMRRTRMTVATGHGAPRQTPSIAAVERINIVDHAHIVIEAGIEVGTEVGIEVVTEAASIVDVTVPGLTLHPQSLITKMTNSARAAARATSQNTATGLETGIDGIGEIATTRTTSTVPVTGKRRSAAAVNEMTRIVTTMMTSIVLRVTVERTATATASMRETQHHEQLLHP